MKKIFLIISFIVISISVTAQNKLLTDNEIHQNEKKVLNAFEKLQKKPNKKKRKEKFVKLFEKSISKNTLQLDELMNETSEFEPNYEAIINQMKALQLLYSISANPIVKDAVKAKNYTKQIDSITNLAVQKMYLLAKELLQKKETPFAYMSAYQYLKRVENLQPDYLDTKLLLEKAILNGQKRVYISPVTYNNLGSFVEFGFGADKSSMSSDFIIKSILNELQIDNPNTTFVKTPLQADWIVNLKWEAVNMGNKRFREYTEERSKEIKENGTTKTVKATIKYIVTTIDVDGELNYQIKEKDNIILNRTISGYSPFSKTEATYTGDKRALNYQDINQINNKNPLFVNDHYDLLTKMYLEEIHPQLMEEIGPLLNWNYPTEIE